MSVLFISKSPKLSVRVHMIQAKGGGNTQTKLGSILSLYDTPGITLPQVVAQGKLGSTIHLEQVFFALAHSGPNTIQKDWSLPYYSSVFGSLWALPSGLNSANQ
jgi:hypothetical protein